MKRRERPPFLVPRQYCEAQTFQGVLLIYRFILATEFIPQLFQQETAFPRHLNRDSTWHGIMNRSSVNRRVVGSSPT